MVNDALSFFPYNPSLRFYTQGITYRVNVSKLNTANLTITHLTNPGLTNAR